ncbi:polysaccharide lyase family 1 protein [Pleurotus ostreatus PC15]|uniref:Polysaccharide lyase family 1 protein n=1 Tax=Pleurotus ostreatus (strain PC15) TaxID=1137138 RepID=A0A067NE79_PLEO1|nr:polysaccharide lyase family 1 protein [Pleurotus ostreatus PC15]
MFVSIPKGPRQYTIGTTLSEPDIIKPGWQVDRFYNNVTFSHNIIRSHHKSLLLDGGTKEADRDRGKMRFTIFGNYFNGSASRFPTMRFRSFDIFYNIYEARNDKTLRFNDAGQAHRREVLGSTPLDAVFQYHLGVYNQST